MSVSGEPTTSVRSLHMPKRRMGTRPQHTYWTPEGIAMIEAYQAKHRIPSFSAAAETLVRLGLDKSPGEILEPIIVSTIRQAVHRELERLVRVQIHTALEAGMARQFAAAALRDIGRMMTDEQRKSNSGRDRHFRIKAHITKETR